jgi:hypothetical protein
MSSSVAYKKLHRKQGLCANDQNIAVAGKTCCVACAKKNIERNKKRNIIVYKYREENRLCKRCGSPLIEGENLTCRNCGGKMAKVMVKCKG